MNEDQIILKTLGFPSLNALFNEGDDIIFALNPDYTYRYVSDNIHRITGYQASELLGANLTEFLRPEDADRLLLHLEGLKNNKHMSIEAYHFRNKNGDWRIMRATAINLSEDSDVLRIIMSSRDVTSEVNQQLALEEANHRYDLILEAANEILWTWDLSNNIIDRSTVLSRVFGYESRYSSTLEFWFSKVPEKDRERVLDSLMAAIGDKDVTKWEEEYGFLHTDGNLRYISDRAFITRDKTGKAINLFGAVLDITESRMFTERIRKKNQLLKDIAWAQSHLLRAPLVRLQGLLELLEDDHETEASMRILAELKNSANEMDEIIRHIVEKSEEQGF